MKNRKISKKMMNAPLKLLMIVYEANLDWIKNIWMKIIRINKIFNLKMMKVVQILTVKMILMK